MLLSFCENAQYLQRCIGALEKNPTLGMVGHHGLIHHEECNDKKAWEKGEDMVRACGLEARNSGFICGTMFLCRASLMQVVKDYMKGTEFEIVSRRVTCSLAHCCERFFGMAVTAQGYTIEDVYHTTIEKAVFNVYCSGLDILRKTGRFLYQDKITLKGKRIIKILRIPVYYKRIGKQE